MVATDILEPVETSAIRAIDKELSGLPPVESPVVCRFTPGLMSREVFMPAGSAYRSKIHNTEHQFIVSQGACFVSEKNGPKFLINAPYHGITKPGTWRTLFIVTDCIWTTFHPTDKTTVEEVEADIIASLGEPT
ncbi:MAG TPA: hypothetical protein VHS96_13360 [Bacteroidia bacterium]|nr:hypothetical protein [Bacteroidia bacterium]